MTHKIYAALTLLLLSTLACTHPTRATIAGPPRPPNNLGNGWVDLVPHMQLRIENAYYQAGAPKKGLAGFLGTEIARYDVLPSGAIKFLDTESHVPQRPPDQAPVQDLLRGPQTRLRFHRYFYQVVLNQKNGAHSAVLLSARTQQELEQLAIEPAASCTPGATHCTVFPEACTVSLEMHILVNGQPRVVAWPSNVASVAPNAKQLSIRRLTAGKLRPYPVKPDPQGLRQPLMPGDQVTWQ